MKLSTLPQNEGIVTECWLIYQITEDLKYHQLVNPLAEEGISVMVGVLIFDDNYAPECHDMW